MKTFLFLVCLLIILYLGFQKTETDETTYYEFLGIQSTRIVISKTETTGNFKNITTFSEIEE